MLSITVTIQHWLEVLGKDKNQKRKVYTSEYLQQIVLRQLDVYVQKNEVGPPISHHIKKLNQM